MLCSAVLYHANQHILVNALNFISNYSIYLGDTPMGVLSVKPLPFLSRIIPSAMRGYDQSMRVRLTIPLGGTPQNTSFKFEYTRSSLKVRCHLGED